MAEKNISEIWNCKKIIDWGVEFFKTKNIDSPRLTIELLLCKVLQCQRIDLYTKYDIPLKDNELELLRELVKRRAKHEPLQYILGTCHFYESEFIVEPGVLIPRPETEILVDEVIKYVKTNELLSNKKSINILEIGSGSGCIALSLAKEIKNSKIISIDISSQAIVIAKKNQNNLKIANVDFIQKDMFSLNFDEHNTLFFQEKFDIIVSNPPYISANEINLLDKNVRDFEPLIALTDQEDGLKFYKYFVTFFPKVLSLDGIFAFEIAFNQKKDIQNLFRENFEIEFIKDYSKIDRIVMGNVKKLLI